VIAIAIIWLTTKYSTNIRGVKMDVDMVISPWLKRRRHTTPLHGMVFPGRAVENVGE
jgi:hypothetical protein